MPPRVALAACIVGILGLMWLDRDEKRRTSPALWIPIIWLAIASSRMLSQWLSLGKGEFDNPEKYLEGSPFDRAVLMVLLGLGLAVLAARGRRAGQIMARNWPILLFFLYCLISVTWSDFPFVAFKRWSKAIGNVVMVMVVLTDRDPHLAVRRFLTRTGFVLVPMSVVLIKYFPELGRAYLSWVWTTIYLGVANTKNGLGYVCLVFGLASAWCLIDAKRRKTDPTRGRRMFAHLVVLLMVGWLFYKANSATSLTCFLIGLLMIALTASPTGRRPILIHMTIAFLLVGSLIAYFTFGAHTYVAEGLGRDSSLSGRTDLWTMLLRFARSPWFGTGFESFWLGKRANYFWEAIWWHPNQAHNGYLETYINLGWVGVALLALTIGYGYQVAVRACDRDPEIGSIRLAYLVVAIIYNLTEAAFKGLHPVWIAFMLASTARPIEVEEPAPARLPLPARSGSKRSHDVSPPQGPQRPALVRPGLRNAGGQAASVERRVRTRPLEMS
jgi:exopolysaccharide production protein ExoQ